MSREFDQHLKALQRLNLEIRQRLEVAEHRAAVLDPLVAQLACTGLVNDMILLGDVILQQAYSVKFEPTGSGQAYQAALAVPGGFGAVLWDSEDLAQTYNTELLETEAFRKFIPFERCIPAVKALLLPQLEGLVRQLMDTVAH